LENKYTMEVPVIKLQQGGLVLYQGSLRARALLETWDVKRFEEEYLKSGGEGYQREEEERAKEISTYVRQCQIPLVPSLLLAVKNSEFIPFERGYGLLKIPRKQGVITVIDGQHRSLGFEWIRRSATERKRLFPSIVKDETRELDNGTLRELSDLLDFELPVTFVDSSIAAQVATEKIDKAILKREHKTRLDEDDVERVLFFVINKTQKGINASLKDALMYLIAGAGIRGIPIIEREKWRASAVPLVRDMHYDKDSPLYGLVNLIGRKGAQQPVKLNTMVGSLKSLVLQDQMFARLSGEQQLEYLKTYWGVLREMYPRAFEEDRIREYLLLRSLSVYALNRLAADIFDWCQKDEVRVPPVDEIRRYLGPLKGFDWSRRSRIAAFGGQRGASEAYRLLLGELGKGGIAEAVERLRALEET